MSEERRRAGDQHERGRCMSAVEAQSGTKTEKKRKGMKRRMKNKARVAGKRRIKKNIIR